MHITHNGSVIVISLEEGEEIMLTTRKHYKKSCIYTSVNNGNLVLTGGSNIVETLKGANWKKVKVEK